MPKLQITYSSNRNITFNNDYSPDYIELPDDWDEMDEAERAKYIDDETEQYLWELVDVYAEVVDGEDVDD